MLEPVCRLQLARRRLRSCGARGGAPPQLVVASAHAAARAGLHTCVQDAHAAAQTAVVHLQSSIARSDYR